ncbi:CDP-diacylglycerol--glycerol-3-phosphate 3-phosphatidyltransferase [Pseudoclavibacter sp. JAI123]|jgi:CDP-diacylglycerol--glycerol-3-phosphate 3-phosphatidyltransferase|uniref:CDP-diacylglycerol--glycerol-3-phosphate 3-phosphatidyltransferase n=1 Tax=unclassified Pseudoclavibacter TaxID=2615177 RepID=UPI0015CD0523|nr:CDP-diacylglycerol--glycerol-3-phosphate 3-phosphatidyltransferase [Pseudoclavibacter sp. JAI123]NYF14657.1 CDP-diacylglycerol--glycerol-3-phosphate 3-phosphatidyltransferase [Pseudoclavibacter sp. JAI123]
MTGRILRGGDGPVSNWCVPNLITIARILLVPVFVWFLLLDGNTDGAWRWAAAVLFIVAIATDSLDGHIARSRNLITDLGKLLDPIADKALTGTALVMLSVLGELPWWVTIIILVRELGITFWRLAVAKKRVLPAGRGGKLKTLVQAFAISLALLPLWVVFGDWVHWVNIVFMSAAFILTVWSGIDYLWQAYRPQNKKTPELRADDGTQR